MSVAYLDTHVAVFLHDGLTELLSSKAKRSIEANDLLISPMVFLELDYLYRRKKTGISARALYATIHAAFGVAICPFPFPATALEALDIGWTMDPFDRLIVAHARANSESVLITRDQLIRKNYHNALW